MADTRWSDSLIKSWTDMARAPINGGGGVSITTPSGTSSQFSVGQPGSMPASLTGMMGHALGLSPNGLFSGNLTGEGALSTLGHTALSIAGGMIPGFAPMNLMAGTLGKLGSLAEKAGFLGTNFSLPSMDQLAMMNQNVDITPQAMMNLMGGLPGTPSQQAAQNEAAQNNIDNGLSLAQSISQTLGLALGLRGSSPSLSDSIRGIDSDPTDPGAPSSAPADAPGPGVGVSGGVGGSGDAGNAE